MKSAGVKNYMEFAEEMLQRVDGLPLSLEVFDDEFDEIKSDEEPESDEEEPESDEEESDTE